MNRASDLAGHFELVGVVEHSTIFKEQDEAADDPGIRRARVRPLR